MAAETDTVTVTQNGNSIVIGNGTGDMAYPYEAVIADTTSTINDVEKTGKMITFNFKP